MSQLLSIYSLTIFASAVFAAALAILGAQISARDRAMQCLCIGQGAMLGVLIGIGILHQFVVSETAVAFWPFVFAVIMSALTFFASERMVKQTVASKNTYFASLFAILLAASYLISSLFPALEGHMAQRYFGDLATISQGEGLMTIVAAVVVMTVVIVKAKCFTRESFDAAIFGNQSMTMGSLFGILCLLTLSFSVQVLGFLFTVTCLFLPTTLLSRHGRPGLSRHLGSCGAVGLVSTSLGFVASLYFSHLPTVPTVVITMAAVGWILSQTNRTA